MPKTKLSSAGRLKGYQDEFSSEFISTDSKILYCKACEKKVGSEKRYQVLQHINTSKHKESVARKRNTNSAMQKQLVECFGSRLTQFSSDLCQAFLAADIPLFKLNNPTLRNFLHKYTNEHIPDESTLRKTYVSRCYEKVMSNIQKSLRNQYVWVSVDETTDSEGRFVTNIVVGALSKEQPTTPYLLNVGQLEVTNNTTVTQFVIDSMKLLWPDGIRYNNVLLMVTDAASYMIKSGTTLKGIFPNLIHLTCLAHGLHRIAETIRSCYPLVDKLVSSVKKIFVKAPSRVQIFRTIAPDTPLPPQPILTRWGSWLEAALYYSEHLPKIREVVKALDPNEAASIELAQQTLSSKELESNLVFITAHFHCIPKAITSLEAVGIPLHQSFAKFDKTVSTLKTVPGVVGETVKQKVTNVLSKNPGYNVLLEIVDVLEGKAPTTPTEQSLSTEQLAAFVNAPVTSCDVERSFSRYKALLRDNRRRLTMESIRHSLVVNCNSEEFTDDEAGTSKSME